MTVHTDFATALMALAWLDATEADSNHLDCTCRFGDPVPDGVTIVHGMITDYDSDCAACALDEFRDDLEEQADAHAPIFGGVDELRNLLRVLEGRNTR